MRLKTDYKDWEAPLTGKEYQLTQLENGNYSIVDVTTYDVEGDSVGAAVLNAIGEEVNNKAVLDEKGKVAAEQTSAAFNSQTADYTLVLSDAGKMVVMNASTDVTLTIPNNEDVPFPVGTEIEICQMGTGAVTIAKPTNGSMYSMDDMVMLAGRFAVACLKKTNTDNWLLAGGLG